MSDELTVEERRALIEHRLSGSGSFSLTNWRRDRAMTRRRSTYSMPGSSGADDFRAKQLPEFEPVDDLSRFVLDRIREAETEPVADQVEPNGQPMAYRYARSLREDCKVFRRITAAYCETQGYSGIRLPGLALAVLEIANRWDDHHNFQEEWRVTA